MLLETHALAVQCDLFEALQCFEKNCAARGFVQPARLLAHSSVLDNVVSTYHTAGVTHEARGRMARIASEQVIDVLAGKRPPRLINPDVWPAYTKRFERIMDFTPET